MRNLKNINNINNINHLFLTRPKKFYELKKNILLGNWCRNINNINSKNISTVNYHWDNNKKYLQDIKYIYKIYHKILKKVSKFLNQAHVLKWNYNQWNIMLGPWLYKYIFIYFDRIEMIKQILKKKNLLIYGYNFTKNDFLTNDLDEFSVISKTQTWNNKFLSKIIKEKTKLKIQLKKKKNVKLKKKKYDIKLITKLVNKIFFFLRNSKSVTFLFYNVWYGNIIQRIQFFFYLKSHSINNERSDLNWLKNINYNYNLRFKYKEKNKNKLKDKFEDIIFSDLLSFLPKIYLEGFKKLSHKSFDQFKNLNTKYVVSSISIYKDELFKFWVANNLKKIKLLTYQHGGQYFFYKLNTMNEKFENYISYKFLSWGTKNSKNTIPLFSPFKLKRNLMYKIFKNTNKTNILIVMKPMPHFYSMPVNVVGKELTYYKGMTIGLLKFFEKINFIVSLKRYPTEEYDKENQIYDDEIFYNKIKKKFKNIIIQTTAINNNIYQKKIIVFTYFGTAFLQFLHEDIPCVVIEKKNYHNKLAEKLYLQAKNSNLIFNSNKDFFKFFYKNNNRIDDWWKNQKTISIVNKIKNYYSKENMGVRQFSKILLSMN
jgi:putative transferase (TIGR04331 family)